MNARLQTTQAEPFVVTAQHSLGQIAVALPELIRMARRVEAVHREHPQVPVGLADLLEAAQGDLLALTNNATPPQGACNTWRALYAGIAQLHDDLVSHIQTENNRLFATFEAAAVASVAPAAACCGACGG